MTLPISALDSPSLATVVVGLLGHLDGGASPPWRPRWRSWRSRGCWRPSPRPPVATVVTFLLTCSAAAEATLACAAVSSALDAICWLTAVSCRDELARVWAISRDAARRCCRRFARNFASPSPIWPTESAPLIVDLPGQVAAAGGVDHFEDALDLGPQVLRLPPLALAGLQDLALGLQLLGDQLPGHHRAEVFLVLVVDRRDQQVGRLGADLDVGPHRQVLVVREDLPLVGGVLVEDVDARAQGVLGLDRQVPLELPKRRQRGGLT